MHRLALKTAVIILVLISVFVIVPTGKTQESISIKEKFEYDVMSSCFPCYDHDICTDKFKNKINEKGKNGWELVSAVNTNITDQDRSCYSFFLKKKIQEE